MRKTHKLFLVRVSRFELEAAPRYARRGPWPQIEIQEASSSLLPECKKRTGFRRNLSFGPSVEIRTRGLLNPIQARYQTSPHPDILFAAQFSLITIPHLFSFFNPLFKFFSFSSRFFLLTTSTQCVIIIHASGNGSAFTHGEMAEWSKAPVLKTGDVKASVGSNPTLSARLYTLIRLCRSTQVAEGAPLLRE